MLLCAPKPFSGQLSLLKTLLPRRIYLQKVVCYASLRNLTFVWKLEVVFPFSCMEKKKKTPFLEDPDKEGSYQVLLLGKYIGFLKGN